MKLTHITLTGLATSAAATKLYVSSYAGNISSLSLSALPQGGYFIQRTAANSGSAPNPSWLTKDQYSGVIYCADEALAGGNGSIASYRTSSDGSLSIIDRHKTLNGPVNTVVYSAGKALAAAMYGGSGIASWTINADGSLNPSQVFTFRLTKPATSTQRAPHPHEVLLDPTASFIIVPDLGSDLLRIFSIDQNAHLTEQTPYPVVNGTGPRHGAFLKTSGGATYLFIVTELAPTVTTYAVTYPTNGRIAFTPVFTSTTYGTHPVPPSSSPGGPFAAEAIISPDGGYLLTSSRGDNLFKIANYDPNNSTLIPSDSLQVWSIDHATGALAFKQLAPAGGSWPRQFSLNKNGTLAAVSLQLDHRVVIIERKGDGTFGNFVADIDIDGEVTSVIWDE